MAKNKTQTDWDSIKQDYITSNARKDESGHMTLGELAKKWKVSRATLANRAASEKWRDEVDRLVDLRNKTALQRVALAEGEEEGAVRLRQSRVARLALSKAAARIQAIQPEELTIPQAISLMTAAMEQERRALGYAQTFEFISAETPDDYESV